MAFFPPIYETTVNALVFLAIAAHFLSAKDNEERLKLILVVGGFFALLFLFENDFFFVQTLVIAWLVVTGAGMIISKKVAIALLAVSMFAPLTTPWFFLISFAIYVIILGGFIFSALKKIAEKIKTIS